MVKLFASSPWFDLSRLFSAITIYQILQGFLLLAIARLLGPVDYGLWTLFLLVLAYGVLAHLGTINAMHREIPFYLGRGEPEQAVRSANTAFSVSLGCSLLLVPVVLLGGLLLRRGGASSAVQLLLLVCLIVLQEAYIYFIYWLRAYQRFGRVARSQMTLGVLNLLLVLLLGSQYRLTGVILGYCLAYGLTVVSMLFRENWNLKLQWDWRTVSAQLGAGLPILLTTMMFLLLTTLDRLFVVRALGLGPLGYFGIGLMLFSFLFNSFDAIPQVVFPRALELYGRTGDPQQVAQLYLRSAEGLSYVLAPVLGLGYFLLPLVIPIVLPDYVSGIRAAQWICLGFGAFIVAQFLTGFYVALERTRRCIGSQLLVFAVKLAVLWLARGMLTIERVAVISSLANGLYLVVVLLASPLPLFHVPRNLARLSLPWLWSFGSLFVLQSAFGAWSRTRLWHGMGEPAIYFLVAIPLLWWLYHTVNSRWRLKEARD